MGFCSIYIVAAMSIFHRVPNAPTIKQHSDDGAETGGRRSFGKGVAAFANCNRPNVASRCPIHHILLFPESCGAAVMFSAVAVDRERIDIQGVCVETEDGQYLA